jgi:saccharopine dehydrogenase (NAD+, L-lysine-forming)
MIYGANGYTGQLVARLAVARGEQPVLAGRRAEPLAALGAELGLAHRTVELTDEAALRAGLADVDLVAHCAGPFVRTAAPMVDACLATGTHYLDVTGEIDVYEEVFARHAEAVAAKVVLLPGAGFDVVPTDCLAAMLVAALPGAISLELAFRSRGGLSPGTAATALLGAGVGGKRRIGGVLQPSPFGVPSRVVPFPSGPRRVGAIPWGDLATAYRSTGIADITTYAVLRPPPVPVQYLMRYGVVQALGARLVARFVSGPSARTRASTGVEVWGEVRDAAGATSSATLVGPNAYDLTADAVVRIAGRVLAGGIPPGAHTPATALGADFIRELDGVTVQEP